MCFQSIGNSAHLGRVSAVVLFLALFLVTAAAPSSAADTEAPTATAEPAPADATPAAPAEGAQPIPQADSFDAAFGLRWFDSKAEIESLGVDLRQAAATPFGDSYTTSYLPRNVPDMNYAVLSFGYNDQLIHITAVGGEFDHDDTAQQVMVRYKELKDVLSKKYGEGRSESHTEKTYTKTMTAIGFWRKQNWTYTVFAQPHMRIELSVISLGGAKMRWRLIFENLEGMAQLKRQRRRSEEAAF